MTEAIRAAIEYGDPALPERFWSKVYPEPNTGCWLWGGAIAKGGYGNFGVRPKTYRAHRLLYVTLVDSDIDGLDIDHLCRVRSCVNPEHLEAVDRLTNLARGTTVVAQNMAKTHCPQGHEYTPDNTWRTKNGNRRCWTCKLSDARKAYRKRRARGLPK